MSTPVYLASVFTKSTGVPVFGVHFTYFGGVKSEAMAIGAKEVAIGLLAPYERRKTYQARLHKNFTSGWMSLRGDLSGGIRHLRR